MKRLSLLPLVFLSISTIAFAQTNPTDPDTLKALLAEVRLLRHDLQTTTITAQRTRILIYRTQAQEAFLRHMQERVDDARSKLAETRSEQKSRTATIKQIEERQSRIETPASEQKYLDDTLVQIKAKLDADASKEQEIQVTLTDAEEQLRIEQAKLGGLQDQWDRLEKSLESFNGSK